MMYVVKADGRKEKFEIEKVLRTCLRAGLKKEEAHAVARFVRSQAKDGMTTHQIHDIIVRETEKLLLHSPLILMLREAIANIDSESYEIYTKKILEADGYTCKWNVLVKGACVEHQVDVIAEKDGKRILVECKKHFNPHRYCGLGVALQVQARFEDINDGFAKKTNNIKFDSIWIFNNTKFSEHIKHYAACKGIRLTGWRHEKEWALDELVEKNKLYPVTILKTEPWVVKNLLQKRIITIRDLLENKGKLEKTLGIDRDRAADLLRQAEKLVG
jgi:hypothetical protein